MKNNKNFISRIHFSLLKKMESSLPKNSLRIWALKRLGFQIGERVYLGKGLQIITESGFNPKLIIGNRVSIGPDVTIMLASGSNNSKLKTKYPLQTGNVMIDNDVWVGTRVIVYPNVHIEECSIITAGAVVNKSVASYTIVGGVPAREIKKIIL